MRRVAVLLLLLFAVVAVASRVPLHHPSREMPVETTVGDDWRRTDDGWERMSAWNVNVSAPDPPLHPLVLALLQLFVSLLALVAYPAANEMQVRTAQKLHPD